MRDKAKQLPALQADAVDSLRIWHCGYRSLSAVAKLQQLHTLSIATFPDDSLAILEPLKRLRCLRIVHLPKISDLSPLSTLRELRILSLATLPSWDSSGRVTEVGSLEPLAALPEIRHLELFGVVSKDRSLAALEQSRTLLSVRLSKYPKEEVARFYRASGVSDDYAPEPPAG